MTRYTVFEPGTELNGRTTLALIRNINREDIESILAKHHLDHVDPDQWYSLQAVLDVLSDISDNINGSENLVAIGMAAAQISVDNVPPTYAKSTVEEWLQAYCTTIYPSRQRNGQCGLLTLQKENECHLILTMLSPYPDDLMYGLFYTFVRHFKSADKSFVLYYDETSPRREKGGPNTIYHIKLC